MIKQLFLLALTMVAFIHAGQAQEVPKEVFSYQLKKAIATYEKRLEKGDSSQLVDHADALFITSQNERALILFMAADKKGMDMTMAQKRNYVHAALRLGTISPYFLRTNYFTPLENMKAWVNATAVNSLAEDLTPFYRDGKLLFSSSRPSSRSKNKFNYPLTGLPYLDIHLYDTTGKAWPLTALPNDLQTDLHDGPLYLSSDSSLLIITRTRPQPGADGVHQLYLAYYQRNQGKWSSQAQFSYNQAGYSTQHPWFDEKTKYLYFSSNAPGGFGGFDLYKSQWQNGVWSQPENLGKDVNSEFDEVFPSLNPEGDLVYATNHIETNGGLDLVWFKEGRRYLLPEPINSRYDDFGLSWKDSWQGYLSSNRTGTPFNDDIYAFAAQVQIKQEPRFSQYLRILMADGSGELRSNEVQLALKGSHQPDSLQLKAYQGVISLGNFKEPLPQWGLSLRLKGHYPVQTQLQFTKAGDSLLATVLLTKKKPVLEAKGFLAIYFQNGEPGKMTEEEAKQLDYRKFFNGYMKGKPVYYQKSASTKAELDALFADIERGMAELELFPSRLDSALQSGRKMKVYMAAYTSASGSAAINKMISERRGTVLKNFIVNWNNGALQKYIDNGQLTVSDEYFPLSDPNEGKRTPGVKQGPEVTMFGVPASRSRRVNVVWETISEGRPEE